MEYRKNEHLLNLIRYHPTGSGKGEVGRTEKSKQREKLRIAATIHSGVDLLKGLSIKCSSKMNKHSKPKKRKSVRKFKVKKTSASRNHNYSRNSNTNNNSNNNHNNYSNNNQRKAPKTERNDREKLSKYYTYIEPASSSNAFMQKLRLNYLRPNSAQKSFLNSKVPHSFRNFNKDVQKFSEFTGWEAHIDGYSQGSTNYSKNSSQTNDKGPIIMNICT